MGGCFSRKKECSCLNASVPQKLFDSSTDEEKLKKKVIEEENVVEEEESLVKKEIFVIKHRKSHDRERLAVSPPQKEEENKVPATGSGSATISSSEMGSSDVVVRTSSCTKEEVDAILIQCGRLSRSNSSGTAGKPAFSGRKYAGSKRSYDLDQEQDLDQVADANYHGTKKGNDGEEDEERTTRQHRQRHRHSQSSSASQGRRRTPSRERDQRSCSRERGNSSSSNSGRRVSRSPGRRSETTPTPNSNSNATNNRPGKMVSVPATVSSLTMEKSNNGAESQTAAAVKRISVTRNVGETGPRTAASPRSQSPARTNARGGGSAENNQQPSLSRSSSRKAEQSPYRRNPLSEIDPNSLVHAQATGNTTINKSKNREAEAHVVVKEVLNQKPNAEVNNMVIGQGPNNKIVKEQTVIVEEAKTQTLTRSRSARRSRDLDLNPETLLNPNPSYTALLLEDIQNFHQKNTNTNTPSFSVPACVAKACSILEAVADLNSTSSPNISCNAGGGKTLTDPFVESEVGVSDDLMEPSLHKYVTVRRGGNGEDMDGQESSGSNSFVGSSQQHWGYYTSSWEPNSADSTDRWTSRSNTREDSEKSPLGFQKHVLSKLGFDMEEAPKGFSGQRSGIGRGRVGSTKTPHSTPIVAATPST